MKKIAVLFSAALMAAFTCSETAAAPPSRQLSPIAHQPVGAASIAPALAIRGFGAEGKDGVSSTFGRARHWSAKIRGVPTTLDFGTTVTVNGGTAGGPAKTLSSLAIREVRLGQARFSLTFSPSFQSATYRVEIWNGPTKVLDVGQLTAGGIVQSGNDFICDAIGKERSVALGICEYTIGTCSQLDDQGRFNWIIQRRAPVSWVIPSVSPDAVVGDQLRIIEETGPNEGDPMMTDVAIRGANLSQILLLDEMANAQVPDTHRLQR
jgi:hypothetical protein